MKNEKTIRMLFFLKKNKLLYAKIIFSVYNILIILTLNTFVSSELAGKLLFIQSGIFLIASLSRFGSDFYWISSQNKCISISRFELGVLSLSSFVLSFIYYFLFISESLDNYFWFLASVLQINLLNFIGRYFQKEKKNVMSLFVLLVAPNFLIVPVLLFFHEANLYILIAISMFAVLLVLILSNDFTLKFQCESGSIGHRLNYFPMAMYGVVNQNLISLLGGVLGSEAQIPILVLFQRLSGLVLWPQVIHMQKDIDKINKSIQDIDVFMGYLRSYIGKNLSQIIIFSALSFLFCIIYLLLFVDIMSFQVVISLILILMASIISVLLTYLQVLIGTSRNGVFSFIVLITSLVLIWICAKVVTYQYITIAFSYFLFHIVNHIANYYIIVRSLSK